MNFEIVIGLEVHAQLKTESKIFCRCSTDFGAEPNSQICPICMGMPGVLPVLNKKAVDLAMRAGLAMNCQIAERSVFARKNYFYPDLPKGYQISQYEEPLCRNGFVEIEIDGEKRKIHLERIHLEEDAGKLIHAEDWLPQGETLVDLNRCGVPLIEIVTKPDIRSPREAALFLEELKRILQYIDVSDCNMEEGSLRCDANISLRLPGSGTLGTKTEVKNMNSFKAVEKALQIEAMRQAEVLKHGGTIQQQTLLWNADRNSVVPMRTKEEADDYRYFPDPDLVPLSIDKDWIDQIRQEIPELPLAKKRRFVDEYRIPEYDASVLSSSRELAEFFEQTVVLFPDAKTVSNFIMGEVLRFLSEKKVMLHETALNPELLADLLELVRDGKINLNVAKKIFPEMAETGKAPEKLVSEKGLAQISDEGEVRASVQAVLSDNPDEVAAFLNGKEKVFGFLVGQVMRAMRGKANPQIVNKVLRDELRKLNGK